MTFFDYPATDEGTSSPTSATYFLADASDADWAELRTAMTVRTLSAGQALINPGDGGRSLYLVLEGTTEVLLPQSRNRWRRVATVESGSVLGELAFLDGAARSALVRALTPLRVAELSEEAFADLAVTRPDLALMIALDLGRILAQRLRRGQASPADGA